MTESRLARSNPGVESAHPESEIPEMITPERWAIVERLYRAALERDEAERRPFLAEACVGDDALRGEVESLLDHDGSAAFLSTPAAVQEGHVPPSDSSSIGQAIGP